MTLIEIRRSFKPLPQTPNIGSEDPNDTRPRYHETSMTQAQRWQFNVDCNASKLTDGPTRNAAQYTRRREAQDHLITKMEQHGVPVLEDPLFF